MCSYVPTVPSEVSEVVKDSLLIFLHLLLFAKQNPLCL
jgi:hypothetical protein